MNIYGCGTFKSFLSFGLIGVLTACAEPATVPQVLDATDKRQASAKSSRVGVEFCKLSVESFSTALVRQIRSNPNYARNLEIWLKQCPDLALALSDFSTTTFVSSANVAAFGEAGSFGGGGTGSGGTVGGGTVGGGTGGGGTVGGGTGGGGTVGGGTGGGGTGGGGSGSNDNTTGQAGSTNTGGGGGGGGQNNTDNTLGSGGNGGSGVVILRYPESYTLTVGAGLTSNTPPASGGFKVTTFSAGTDTISFS